MEQQRKEQEDVGGTNPPRTDRPGEPRTGGTERPGEGDRRDKSSPEKKNPGKGGGDR